MQKVTMMLLAMMLSIACIAQADDLIQTAREQLRAARAANTEEAYLTAEAILNQAVQQDPGNPLAILYRGAAKMEPSGWLAQKGRFVLANEALAAACADFDSAVTIAPDDFEVRKMRGMIYARFPSFLNKSKLAREDLEFVIHHPRFATEEESTRAQVRSALEHLTVERPDRFPKIAAETSPLMVAATVTIPDYKEIRDRNSLPTFIKSMMTQITAQPGLLGTHLLFSVDQPGMLVIMTWWKDKIALNNFFYGDVHQSLVRSRFNGSANAQSATIPTQVGIELFSILPGDVQVNGGLIPDSVRK